MITDNISLSFRGRALGWLSFTGRTNRAKMAALLAMSLLGGGQALAQAPEPVCKPEKLYDIISSAFHQSVAQMNDGNWKIWGERGNPNTMAHAYAPVDLVLPESAPGVRPKALLVAVAGTTNTDSQDIVLGNDGAFYAWGNSNAVLPSTYTTSTTLHKTTLQLPTGVNAGDVEMMMASYHFLVIVTSKTSATEGAAFVIINGANASLLGDGGASAVSQDWHRVKTGAGADLKNIIAVRAHVNSTGRGAAIALTEDSNGDRKIYTWGNSSRVAGAGTGVTDHSYATELTAPAGVAGKPKQIGVTGGNGTTNKTAFYALYTAQDPTRFDSVGTLWAMGENASRQLGNLDTTSTNTWQQVKKPASYNATTGLWSGDGGAFTDVRMFSVQEHDAGGSSAGSGALIVANGDVYTWGSNSGAMIGGKADSSSYTGMVTNTYTAEGEGALDPAIRGFLMNSKKPSGGGDTSAMGNIKARYIELGGHTTAFLPEKKPQYCYVGHKVNGSMGDGQPNEITKKWQFQCEGTAAMTICGSDAIVAKDDAYGAIPVPDVTYELSGNVYDNDEWQGEKATDKLDKIKGEVLVPASPINWGPVPYLDVATGKVIVPPGTHPGDYTIKYRIKDNDFPTTIYDDATITVSVLGIKAIPDTDTTTPGNPVTTTVTDNDTSPSGEPIDKDSVTVVSQPPNGNVVCYGDAAGGSAAGLTPGQCKYTPVPGFKGTDTYTYKVCNGKNPGPECDTTTVTVAVGEPPAIAAYPDVDVTTVNVPVTTPVLANDIAVGGAIDPASVELVGNAPAGTSVSCANGYCTLNSATAGTYEYTYKVCMAAPNAGVCTTSTVQVLVTAGGAGNPGITAAPDFDATPKNTPVTTTVLYNDKAVGGTIDPATVTVTGNPSHGGTSVDSTGKITYTPTTDFVGTDTYTYQVCLTGGTPCTTTTVTVKVGDPAITAKDDNDRVPPGGGTVTTPVLTNDTPVGSELDPASITIVTPPAHGTAVPNPDGTVSYTPGTGYDGPDEYTYQVCLKNPKEACATAKVKLASDRPDVVALIQSPAAANPGDEVMALLRFGNIGNKPAPDVTYKLTGLPTGLTGVECAGAACEYDPSNGTVTITGLPTTLTPGQQQDVQLHWKVPAGATDGTEYTLEAAVTTSDTTNPPANDKQQAKLTMQTAPLAASEVTTTVDVPVGAGANEPVNGKVKYLNIGSVEATGVTYKVELSAGTPSVSYQGTPCTLTAGVLSDCGLPDKLAPGLSLELDVTYTAPAADGSVTVKSTVGAGNDTNPNNNEATGTTRTPAALPQVPDVTVTVAPPPTAVTGTMVNVPVTFENLGPAKAEDVTYKVTLPKDLTDVSCTPASPGCAYDPGTGEVTVKPGNLPGTLNPGDKTSLTVTYKAPPSGPVEIEARVDAKDEPLVNQPNNTAKAQTLILVPGDLFLEKTVYEGHDSGAKCVYPKATNSKLLTIVEKNPTNHNVTWCFVVRNTGTTYLGAPVFNDPELPSGTVYTPKAGTTLPLAPGAVGIWYVNDVRNKSVLNTVSLEMPVTDSSNTPIPGAPKATGEDRTQTIFGMIYDPPFGMKVGTLAGNDVIRWTMVWVNDNVVPANGVTVSDVIQAPMTFINDGSLACVGEGATTATACTYDGASKTVSAVANFGPDFGKTVTTAQNRLFISFNVSVPASGGSYTNQGTARWTPPGGTTPLEGDTTYIQGMTVGPVTPGGGVPPVSLPPGATGGPGSPLPTPVAPAPKPIPVDNPLALLAAALGIIGLAARRQRRQARR